MNFYFIDKARNDEIVCIEADSHPDALEVAYDTMIEPEFWYAEEVSEVEE